MKYNATMAWIKADFNTNNIALIDDYTIHSDDVLDLSMDLQNKVKMWSNTIVYMVYQTKPIITHGYNEFRALENNEMYHYYAILVSDNTNTYKSFGGEFMERLKQIPLKVLRDRYIDDILNTI